MAPSDSNNVVAANGRIPPTVLVSTNALRTPRTPTFTDITRNLPSNVGTSAPLLITSVQRLMGSAGFEVSQNPGTPVEVRPGEHVDFTVAFAATTPGTEEKATIRIVSNDQDAPTVDLIAVGLGGTPRLQTVIADRGDFGDVCVGEFVDRDLVLNNAGVCRLHIREISSTSPAFRAPRVNSFPLVGHTPSDG